MSDPGALKGPCGRAWRRTFAEPKNKDLRREVRSAVKSLEKVLRQRELASPLGEVFTQLGYRRMAKLHYAGKCGADCLCRRTGLRDR